MEAAFLSSSLDFLFPIIITESEDMSQGGGGLSLRKK